MKQRVLINCSNLHGGGAVAVASSFIDCLSRLDHQGLSISLLLSKSVERNLLDLGVVFDVFDTCLVRDYYGIRAIWEGLDRHFCGFDLVFTVFGPAYFMHSRTRHVFGFAQPFIVYPDNEIVRNMSFLKRWNTRLKYFIQSWFFSRADRLVVELEHVKSGLAKNALLRHMPVSIVYSSVHSVFNEPSQWTSLEIPTLPDRLRLGVISRNYPHKNLAILAEVKLILERTYKRDVDIYVTFQADEWASCDERFRDCVKNVGHLRLSQCPSFYAAMDAVIFPSLLECFSAVPIEAMMMKRPLFASDLPFIRDVCGDYCQYFDPKDAQSIAKSINDYFCKDVAERQKLCDEAYAHVERYPGPRERAASYLKVMLTKLSF